MNSTVSNRAAGSGASPRAFTVLELLVGVSILTLIILVLYGLFDQTQRALRGNANQVDVMEGGRAAMELMTREMEQMIASRVLEATNLLVQRVAPPTRQELNEPGLYRTNLLQSFFFLSEFNRDLSLIGYKVVPVNGVGTLYRFAVRTNSTRPALPVYAGLTDAYWARANTNYPREFQRVLDGLVHFRIRAFDGRGQLMTWRTNNYIGLNMTDDGSGETRYVFTHTALPAYLELEMGILEPSAVERLKSFATLASAANYLQRSAGRIHLFQQRIPVRTAQ